jgi:hypothetical protein
VTVITNWRCGATCQASELVGGVSSKLTTWAGINSESRDGPDSPGRSNLKRAHLDMRLAILAAP